MYKTINTGNNCVNYRGFDIVRNQGGHNPPSSFLNNIADTELTPDVTLKKTSFLSNVRSWFFPSQPQHEVIEMGDIEESGRGLMSEARTVAAHNESRGKFNFVPVVKKAAALLAAGAAGAAAAYAYNRHDCPQQSASGDVTTLLPEHASEPFIAPLLVGFNLFPNRESRHVMYERNKAESQLAGDPDVDSVKIEKLYDFSCLDVRNNMGFADGLRAVSQAISQPVTSLAKESQVVHTMNTKRTGCPKKQDVETLEKITKPIDYVISTVMSLIPGFRVVAVMQRVVAPVLEMAADDLQGVEVEPGDRALAFLQITDMLRQILATLKPEERVDMYKNADGSRAAKDLIKKRVTLENGKARVTVDNKKYELHLTKPEGMPYINDEEAGSYFFIKYNQKTERWDKVDENTSMGKSNHYVEYKDNKEKTIKFGLNLDKELPEGKLEILKDSRFPGLYLLHRENDSDIKGVFVHNVFIPVEHLKVNHQWVLATVPNSGVRAMLEYTDYGWKFEKKSTAMDKYTRMLLDSPGHSAPQEFTDNHWFSQIGEDEICSDNFGYTYIKKDDRYYWVDAVPGGYGVHSSPTSLMIRENGIFRLKNDEDMLFGVDPILVGSEHFRGWFEDRSIERGAVDYLENYAEKNHEMIISSSQIHSGVFWMTDNSFAFVTEKSRCNILEATDEYAKIAREGGGAITLKMQGYTYLRERDAKFRGKFKYNKLTKCREKRSPGGSCSGLPVMMENELEKKLNDFIAAGKSSQSAIRNPNLREDGMIPGGAIYNDNKTGKTYFLHKGQFFDAIVLKSGARDNHANKNINAYEIYGRESFFQKKEHIDTIMIEQAGDKIIIKPQSVYLAEQINVTDEIAREYIRTRRYSYSGGLRDIEDAVNGVTTSGKFYFAKVPKTFMPEFTKTAIEWQIRNMFPARIAKNSNYEINVFGLNADPSTLTEYQRGAQVFFKSKFNLISRHIIPTVFAASRFGNENYKWNAVRDYLTSYFGNPGEKFLNDFECAYRDILRRMQTVINAGKIKIVSAMIKNSPAALGFESSEGMLLTDTERRAGQVAFMAADEKSIMYVCADKTYVMPGVDFSPGADLVSVLLHELSHAEGMTTDITYIPRNKDGKYIPIMDATEDMINKISRWEVIQSDDFKKRAAEYIKNVVLYRNKLPKEITNQLSILVDSDPGFRGYTMLNNADSVSMMTLDMFEAAIYGTGKAKPENSVQHLRPENKYIGDEYGTVYNWRDGYLIKTYDSESGNTRGTSIFMPNNQYMSRIDIAIKNAECINAIFGKGSATAFENSGSYTASVRFKKIPGEPVADFIQKIHEPHDYDYRKDVIEMILGRHNPADILTNRLINGGVIVHDTSLKNLFFDKDEGFNFIGYESADLWPDKTKIPLSEIQRMKTEIKAAIANFAIQCGMNPGHTLTKIGLSVDEHGGLA